MNLNCDIPSLRDAVPSDGATRDTLCTPLGYGTLSLFTPHVRVTPSDGSISSQERFKKVTKELTVLHAEFEGSCTEAS